MKEKYTDSEQTKGSLALPREEIKRKHEEARVRIEALKERYESSTGYTDAEKVGEAEEELKKFEDEIMWLEMQLQALDASMSMFKMEPREVGEDKLQKLGIQILKEGEQRMSQFKADLENLEAEVWKVRKLYLELVSKIGALLKEARRTAFVLEEVKEFVPPGDRIVTTSLLVPELSELVIGSNEVKKALEK